MSRRFTVIAAFLCFAAFIGWYAIGFMDIPEETFSRAEIVKDSVKKVIIPGTVVPSRGITPEGSTLTFYMVDTEGKESKVFYDGTDSVAASDLQTASGNGSSISVAGHACGDRFHAKEVYLTSN